MNYPILEFSHNWNNKLDCQCFTTLRISTMYKVGDDYEIWLWLDRKKTEKKVLGIAKIIDIKQILAVNFTEGMARIDTSYSREDTLQILKKMYKNYDFQHQPIIWILLDYQKRFDYVSTTLQAPCPTLDNC